jgi:hypothetical protein
MALFQQCTGFLSVSLLVLGLFITRPSPTGVVNSIIIEFISLFLFRTLNCVPAFHAKDDLFSVINQSFLVGFMLQCWFYAVFKVHLQIFREN